MIVRRILPILALVLIAVSASAQNTANTEQNRWPRYIPVRPDGSTIDPPAPGAANPYPGSDYATSGKQDTGNGSAATTATNTGAISTALGAKGDAQATDDTGSWSPIALLKRISAALRGTLTVQPVPAAFTRIFCTLPAYAAGGNAVCTDATGTQTTTTCAASAACQILPANAARKYLFAMNATPASGGSIVSISLGYTATAAPGNARSLDGPSAAGGQGGFFEWGVPPSNAIFAVSATSGATLVIEQGQ